MSEQEQVLITEEEGRVAQLRTVLEGQHAIHGMMARVFDRLGGEDFVYEWAQDNPGRFIGMFVKATPTLAPLQGMQGDIQLTVNNHLVSTSLDD